LNFLKYNFEKTIDLEFVEMLESIIKTTSGDVNVYGSIPSLKVKSISGDIEVQTDKLLKITVDSTSGDVDLLIPKNSSFELDFDSISGELINEFPTTISHQSDSSFKGRVGLGNGKIVVRTISGDLEVKSDFSDVLD